MLPVQTTGGISLGIVLTTLTPETTIITSAVLVHV